MPSRHAWRVYLCGLDQDLVPAARSRAAGRGVEAGGQLLMNNNNFPQPLSHPLHTSDLLFRTLLCKIYFST